MTRRRPLPGSLLATTVSFLLLAAAACGSDDATTTATAGTAGTTAGSTADTADTSTGNSAADSTADSTGNAPGDTAGTSAADAFPVSIEHKFGETVVPAEPQRVVSVGFSDQDFVLALGVQPVGIRDWYGEQPDATWPWAQDELGDATPTVLSAAELNFEAVAALDPDLIVGVTSGMTDTQYASLSAIAPTIAQPGEYIDYGVPWDVTQQIIGDALGRGEEAARIVQEVRDRFAEVRAEHPEFDGATAAVGFTYEDLPGAYASSDSRSRVMADLGFVIPEQFDELAGASFYFTVSQEELAVLDTDVLLWIASSAADAEPLRSLTLRPTLRAVQQGREVLATDLLAGAFSFGSPLSLEYLLDNLVPELALAVDGDPATVVPSAAALAG